MKVLIQAGHSAAYPPYLVGGGGAPGEATWTTGLAATIKVGLEARGVACVLVGCWPTNNTGVPPEVRKDYDLFVSLHYDAAIYGLEHNTGCFADRARNDPVGANSDNAVRAWETVYPATTGIPLHNERRNPNTWDYYAFRATSNKTPGIIVEHGVGMGLDHATLYDRTALVAGADIAAILATLGIRPPTPPPPEVPDVSILTPDQAIAAAQALWGYRQVPANPDTAIFKSWLKEWRAGRFRGLPLTLELPVEQGVAVQGFDAGAASWVDGKEVSWEG